MKKTIFATILAFAIIFFGTSCFANNMMDNIGNGMRNVVNGAGNIVEDTAEGAGNVISGVAGGIDNGIDNMSDSTQNITRGGLMSDTNNSNYTATRTATSVNTAGNSTFLGMNATAWGWLIMAIVGAAIVGLVWFYGKEHEDGYYPDHEDNY